MSKYNESSTNWKLDSWHSIVLQLFILALIGGLSIFIYAKFFGPETTGTRSKDPKIPELEAKIRQFVKEIADLKDLIKEAEKDLDVIVGDKKSGQVTLNQAAESFDTMFTLLGSIIACERNPFNFEALIVDQNATFEDAQVAYNKLEAALTKLKESDLFKLKVTISTEEGKVFGQENEIKRIQTLIGSRKKDVEEYNKWKDKALKSTDAAEKTLAEGKVEKMYEVTVYAETQLGKLAVDLEEAETKLKKLKDDVKQAKAKKKELDDKVAGYDDKLEAFSERMDTWKELVENNNVEKKELVEKEKEFAELQEMLSGTNMVAVVDGYTSKRLKKAIKVKDDFIADTEAKIQIKTKQADAKQAGLEALLGFYKTMNIDIPADPSLPPLPDGSVPPKPTDEVDPNSNSSLPPLPDGVDPGQMKLDPTTGLPATTGLDGVDPGPIDPTTGLPTATGLGGMSQTGTGVVPGFEEKQSETAIKRVEGIRAEIKVLRSEVEQLKKEKLKAEGSIEKLREDLATFEQARNDRISQSTNAGSRMAELLEAEKLLAGYRAAITGYNIKGAVAAFHMTSVSNEVKMLELRDINQTAIHTSALEKIELFEEELQDEKENLETTKEQLITALLADKNKKKVEDLQMELSNRSEDVGIVNDELKREIKRRDDAGEQIEKLRTQITTVDEALKIFIDDLNDKVVVEKAQKASRKNLEDVYGKLIGDEWELAAINFVRKKEEVTTSQKKKLKEYSEGVAKTAKELVATLEEEAASLALELKFWRGMQRRGNDNTKSTADDEVKKINLLIGTNDLDLGKAIAKVEKSEVRKIEALRSYEERLEEEKTIFDRLDAREAALAERGKLLASAKANAEMAKQYNEELSSRERKSELSDLDERIAAQQGKVPGLSNKITTLTKVVDGLKSDLADAEIALDDEKEGFENADLEEDGDSIRNAGAKLIMLDAKVRGFKKQLDQKQAELAEAKSSLKSTTDLVAVLKQAKQKVARGPGRIVPPPPPILKQLRVAFTPYYTDPTGLEQRYDEAVHLVMKEPKDKAAAKKLIDEQTVVVENLVKRYNAYWALRENASKAKSKNYTAELNNVWSHIKGKFPSALDEAGQFHHKNLNFTPTEDGETLYVFCIGRKNDKVRFAVEKVNFKKSPQGPQKILLSSAK